MSLRILGLRPFFCYSHFLRLKRPLEQAHPSMAKKLKVGAVPKGSGEWFILHSVVLELGGSSIELLSD